MHGIMYMLTGPSTDSLIAGCPQEVDSMWMMSWPATPQSSVRTVHCSTAHNFAGGATGIVTVCTMILRAAPFHNESYKEALLSSMENI